METTPATTASTMPKFRRLPSSSTTISSQRQGGTPAGKAALPQQLDLLPIQSVQGLDDAEGQLVVRGGAALIPTHLPPWPA